MTRTRRRLTGDHNQCPTCVEFFNSIAAFEKHRTGRIGAPFDAPDVRRCLTSDEMRARGMAINAAGFWVTERLNARDVAQKMATAGATNEEATPGEAARSGS